MAIRLDDDCRTIGLEAVIDLSNFSAGIDALGKETSRAEKSLGDFASHIYDSFASLGGVIVGLGAALTAAVGAASIYATKQFSEFVSTSVEESSKLEQQLADIAAVMGETLDEVQPLRKTIQELAIDPKLKVNTFQAADAMEMLAKNGLSMDQILQGATRSVIALSNTTGGDFSQAANIVTDVLNNFNIKASDTKTIIDQVTAVVNESKFDLNDYFLALSNSGAIASEVGLSFEDLNAGLIAVSSAYNTGRRAGTGFSTALLNLVPKSKATAEMMQQLGFITEQGTSVFFDATGSFAGLENAAQQLQDRLGKLTDVQRDFYIRQLFGIDAQETIISLMRSGADGIAKIKAEMAKVNAFKSAETRMKTLAGSVEVLDGILEALRINFSYKALPAMRKGLNALNDILFANFDNIAGLGDAFTMIVNKLVDVLVPLAQVWVPKALEASNKFAIYITRLVETGDLFNDKFSQLPKIIQKFIDFSVKAVHWVIEFAQQVYQGAIKVALILKPIWNWIAANVELKDVLIVMALAVAAFVAPLPIFIAKTIAFATAVVIVVDKIRKAWEGNWGDIQGFTKDVLSAIFKIIQTFFTIIQTLFGAYGGDVMSGLEKAFRAVQPVILGALKVIQRVLDYTLMLLQGNWRQVWEELSTIAQGALDQIPDLLTRLWEYVKPILNNFVQYIMQKFNEIDWKGIWEKALDFSKPYIDRLWEYLVEKYNLALDFIRNTDWKGIFQQIYAYIKPYIDLIWNYLVEKYTQARDFILNIDWNVVWGKIYEFFKPVIDKIEARWKQFVDWFSATPFGQVFFMLVDFFSQVGKAVWETIKPIYEFIKANVTMTEVVTFAVVIIENFIRWWTLASATLIIRAGLITTAIMLLRKAWETNWAGIRDFVQEALNRISRIIQTASQIINSLWEGYGGGILDALEKVFRVAESIVLYGLEAIQTVLDIVLAVINGDWEGAWGKLKTFLQDTWDEIIFIVSTAFDIVKTLVQSIDWKKTFEGLSKVAKEAWDFFAEQATIAWGFIVEFWKSVDWNQLWENTKTVAGEVWSAIVTIATGAWDLIKFVWSKIDWNQIWENTKRIAGEVWGFIVTIATQIWGVIRDYWSKIDWHQIWENTKIVAGEVWAFIVTVSTAVWGKIKDYWNGIDWNQIWENTKRIAGEVWGFIVTVSTDVWGKIKDFWNGIDWHQIWENTKRIAGEVWEWIKSTSTNIWGKIKDFWDGIDWNEIWLKTKIVAGNVWKWITDTANGIWVTIRDYWATIDWDNIWSVVKTAAQTAWDSVVTYVKNINWEQIIKDLFPAQPLQGKLLMMLHAIEGAVLQVGILLDTLSLSFSTGTGPGGKKSIADSVQDFLGQVAGGIQDLANLIQLVALSFQYLDAYLHKDAVAIAKITDEIRSLEEAMSEKAARDAAAGKASGFAPFSGHFMNPFAKATDDTAFQDRLTAQMSAASKSIDDSLVEMRKKLDVHFLAIEDAFSMMGVLSLQRFAEVMTGDKSVAAQASVTEFVDHVTVLASAIKAGFYQAGSDSVEQYISSLAAKYGIVDSKGHELADRIIVSVVGPVSTQAKPQMDSSLQTGVVDPITGAVPKVVQEGTNLGEKSVESIGTGAVNQQPATKGIYQTMIEALSATGEPLPPNFETIGGESATGLGTGVDDKKKPTLDIVSTMIGEARDKAFELIAFLHTIGQSATVALTIPFERDGPGFFQQHYNVLMETIKTSMANLLLYMNDRGVAAAAELAAGLLSSSHFVTDAINQIITAATTGVSVQPFTDLGTNMGTALANGLNSQIGTVQAKAAELTNAAAAATAAAAQIASPSKVFTRLGQMSGEGYSAGLLDTLDRLKIAVTSMVGSIAMGVQQQALTPALASSSMVRNYSTSSQSNVNMGPFNVNNQMDAAELEFKIRRIINETRVP